MIKSFPFGIYNTCHPSTTTIITVWRERERETERERERERERCENRAITK